MAVVERNIVGIVDGGGRGAALARAYEKSPHVDGLVVIPGNDIIKAMAKKPTQIFPQFKTTSVKDITRTFQEQGVILADVAQDNAIEAGVSDSLRNVGIATVGPSRRAGEIEWSKVKARVLGKQAKIRQPSFTHHQTVEEGDAYIDLNLFGGNGYAVKANGLAEGKGVKIARTPDEARHAIRQLKDQFPSAAEVYLLEQLVEGEEFSTFFASDGEHVSILGHAQDHKREANRDEGENTGGMGCSTPPLLMTEGLKIAVSKEVQKMMSVLNKHEIPYEGVGYYGGMYDYRKKALNNIEWNARWGDPEVQVVAPGLTSDMFELAMAIVNKSLDKFEVSSDRLARIVVAGASRGYPRDYSAVKGMQIFGLEDVMDMKGVELYGAGIKIDEEGNFRANGGRLFYIVGEGQSIIEAREKAYGAMARVYVDGNNLIFRDDIGWRDVQRLRESGY